MTVQGMQGWQAYHGDSGEADPLKATGPVWTTARQARAYARTLPAAYLWLLEWDEDSRKWRHLFVSWKTRY